MRDEDIDRRLISRDAPRRAHENFSVSNRDGASFQCKIDDVRRIEDLKRWRSVVFPLIRKDSARIDRNWFVPALWRIVFWVSAKKDPHCAVAYYTDSLNEKLPLGILFYLGSQKFILDINSMSHYSYFLSTFPRDGVLPSEVLAPRGVGRHLIAHVVSKSILLGQNGFHWLHAAAKGKSLPAYYMGQCHMKPVDQSRTFYIRENLTNTHRDLYFTHEADTALMLMRDVSPEWGQ